MTRWYLENRLVGWQRVRIRVELCGRDEASASGKSEEGPLPGKPRVCGQIIYGDAKLKSFAPFEKERRSGPDDAADLRPWTDGRSVGRSTLLTSCSNRSNRELNVSSVIID